MRRDGYGKGAVSVGKLGFKTGTKAIVETTVKLPLCFNQKSLVAVGISGPGNKCNAEWTFIQSLKIPQTMNYFNTKPV